MRLLVTGGSGTFGRAFVRRAIASGRYKAIVTYSRDEQKAAALVDEFGDAAEFRAFLGDVRDLGRLEMALRGVDHVVHAAALKRVDVGAYSPSELIATNITGTQNVVRAAILAGAKRVVVVSSDKAVEPTNIYGATKQVAETFAVQANAYGYPSGTLIAAVRYGNIVGSRGSVFHIWREHHRRNEPLTITHPSMTRFVMTIEQAAELVEFALAETQGGEVFVPVLASATVRELAQAVCGDGWPVVVRGIRPGGEKMHERLLSQEEPTRTRHRLALDRDPFDVWRYDTPMNVYAISPSHHEWTKPNHGWFGSAKTLDADDGRRFDSDRAERLSIESIRDLISRTEACR